MEKPIATFSGGTFRELVRQYSSERMKRDPRYRRLVFKIFAQKRRAKAESQSVAHAGT